MLNENFVGPQFDSGRLHHKNIWGRKVFDNETSKDAENPTMLKSYDHFDQRSKLKSTANANDYSPAQVALAA